WSDIIAASFDSDSIWVLANDQHGHFSRYESLGTSGRPTFVDCADLDHDGHSDWIVANANGVVDLFVNTANSVVRHSVVVGGPLNSFSIGDLDGDGYDDLAVTGGAPNLSANRLTVLWGHVDGVFSINDSETFSLGLFTPVRCLLGDLDGDGDLD